MEAAKMGAVIAIIAVVGFGALYQYGTDERDTILGASPGELEDHWQSHDGSVDAVEQTARPRPRSQTNRRRVTGGRRIQTDTAREAVRKYYERQRRTTPRVAGTPEEREEALRKFWARYPHLRQGARPSIGAPRPQDEANYWDGYTQAQREQAAVNDLLRESRNAQRRYGVPADQRRRITTMRSRQRQLNEYASQCDDRARDAWRDGQYAGEVWSHRQEALEARQEVVAVESEIQDVMSR